MISIQKSFSDQGQEIKGTLYLVATPIGNLEDMTFRAIRTLKEVSLIAAEDTRQTRKLITHFEIATRLVSYHEHNKQASGPELIRLLEEGQSIALVSDAGLPAVSDPGADLVADAIASGIKVVPIPGANAALSALIISGLSTEKFVFTGFPPRDKKSLTKWLSALKSQNGTLMTYESPHRLRKTLEAMLEQLGDRRIAMIRELTKRHEEAARGTLSECIAWIQEHPPLGEYCLIIEGADAAAEAGRSSVTEEEAEVWWKSLELEDHVAHYEAEHGRKEAIKLTAVDRGLPKRDVYNAVNR
ncbi:16S rRNA (cytidine(1402)-2'-O)-methyltransferase [Paenibacillus radicis (ex Gao et al. 2016)]|uniref:Ribosomal RNA small subunit methyltransferase I n=1 Tax=Paenibacillus radicis (ex Gao et al. 2016) TaxID=1737354 RepID=A0A917HRM0_9BACL|nr:16S rRNA (cytidine(1402)-2'-O)-methyltransferase [Paenibacillus radicis (ex Gao et al. 2016)]GGG87367.1 ribosomal RNA small subunit methyltransferase I [Paenibacillus radicis (ex Gao et al. 2016)]